MAAGDPITDNPWLDKHDIQDLADAVRGLTKFLRDGEQRHQYALNRLSQADPITQMLEVMRGLRSDVQALRDDITELHAAFAAWLGNGHDTATTQETDHG